MLRKEEKFLASQVLVIKTQNELQQGRSSSSILMDVPNKWFNSVEQVVERAMDKSEWQLEANSLHWRPPAGAKAEQVELSKPVNHKSNRKPNTTATATHRYNLRNRK